MLWRITNFTTQNYASWAWLPWADFLRACVLFVCFGHTTQLVGYLFLEQELNPGPWQWKSSVLTTGPPGNFLELFIFKNQQTREKLWKPSRSYPFVRDIYIYKEISMWRVSPLCTRKRRVNKLLEILINGEGYNLAPQNNQTPVYLFFTWYLHYRPSSHPTTSFFCI